jgi:hypothetical protein
MDEARGEGGLRTNIFAIFVDASYGWQAISLPEKILPPRLDWGIFDSCGVSFGQDIIAAGDNKHALARLFFIELAFGFLFEKIISFVVFVLAGKILVLLSKPVIFGNKPLLFFFDLETSVLDPRVLDRNPKQHHKKNAQKHFELKFPLA